MNRYLIVSPFAPPYWGGSIVYISTIVENCSEQFDILTNALPEGQQEIIGGKDRPIRKKWIRSMFGRSGILKKLITYPYILAWIMLTSLRHRYDAIIVNWAPAPNGLVHMLGRLLGIRTIGLLHGEEITLTLRSKGLRGMVKRWLMLTGYRMADGFVASCHFIKEMAVTIGVDPSIIDVIPVCFNPKNVGTSAVDRVRGYNIITVGTAVERKGFHVLLDAVHELRYRVPQIRVHIVGDGPFMPVVRERIARYGLGDRVVLHGNLFEHQLSRLFEKCDLFVLACRMLDDGNTEGGSLVVCDAMSHGLPAIGGTGGGLATTIDDGETGFIVDSANVPLLASRIEQILADPELAERMGKAGREKIKRDHDPKKAGRQFGLSIARMAAA